jgi:ATP synthase protein I
MALRPRPASTSMGRALEAGLEFGLCVFVGAGLGYYADRWWGTEPWALLVGVGLGFAAGLRTLLRLAAAAGRPPGSGPRDREQ